MRHRSGGEGTTDDPDDEGSITLAQTSSKTKAAVAAAQEVCRPQFNSVD